MQCKSPHFIWLQKINVAAAAETIELVSLELLLYGVNAWLSRQVRGFIKILICSGALYIILRLFWHNNLPKCWAYLFMFFPILNTFNLKFKSTQCSTWAQINLSKRPLKVIILAFWKYHSSAISEFGFFGSKSDENYAKNNTDLTKSVKFRWPFQFNEFILPIWNA